MRQEGTSPPVSDVGFGAAPLIAFLKQRRLTHDDLYHLKALSTYCGSCMALVLSRRTVSYSPLVGQYLA